MGLNRAPVEARARFFKKNCASEQTLQLIFTFPHPQFSTKTPRKLDLRNTLHVKPPVAGAKLGPRRQPKYRKYHILGCSRPPGPPRGLQGAFLVHFHFFSCARKRRSDAQHNTAQHRRAQQRQQSRPSGNTTFRYDACFHSLQGCTNAMLPLAPTWHSRKPGPAECAKRLNISCLISGHDL